MTRRSVRGDDWGAARSRPGTVRHRPRGGLCGARGARPGRDGGPVRGERDSTPGAPLVAVIDPVDGSTNASRRIPWYACSICILDGDGPRVSYVGNLVADVRYTAIRGQGSWRNGERLVPSGCTEIGKSIIALSGYPRHMMGWSQFRALRCGLARPLCRCRGSSRRLRRRRGIGARILGLPGRDARLYRGRGCGARNRWVRARGNRPRGAPAGRCRRHGRATGPGYRRRSTGPARCRTMSPKKRAPKRRSGGARGASSGSVKPVRLAHWRGGRCAQGALPHRGRSEQGRLLLPVGSWRGPERL